MANLLDRRINRTDVWYGLGLFLLTVLSRIPFCSQILYHWDSVNLAFGMQKLDVAAEQPQPPGYIVYVWLCRLVDLLLHDPQMTMVGIAIISSGLAVVTMYLLGQTMFGRRTGLVAALLLASSPLFWFYGEIALPHTLDAFLVTLSGWGLYQMMRGRTGFLYPTVVFLVLVGGVRQQSLIFLLPLTLFALRRVGRRRLLTAALLGAALCLLWAIPLFASSGGVMRYLEVFFTYSGRFTATTSVLSGAGWPGLRRNVSRVTRYVLYAWNLALLPPVIYAMIRFIRGPRRVQWEKVIFLGLWCVPTALLYVFIHMGQQGMIFTFLPALLVVSAATLVRLLEARPAHLLAWISVLLVAINAFFFLLLPEYPLGRERLKVLSWDTLRRNDAYYQERFDSIREHFPAESTAVIASNWRHVQWYLPEYGLLPASVVDHKILTGPTTNAVHRVSLTDLNLQPEPSEVTLVIFDPELRAFNRSNARTTHLALDGDETLDVLKVGMHEQLFYDSTSFGIRGE